MSDLPETRDVLLLENIHPSATEVFSRHGLHVHSRSGSLSEDELIEALQDKLLVGIRSNTKITRRVLEACPDLRGVGAFCIGTNQIDLEAASELGVGCFNAPHSNTRSVVELVIAEIIALARRLEEKSQRMHEGIWDKSAHGAHEVRGRTLGIVGYGNIGTQLGNLAEAIGMRVIFYDITDRPAHGTVRRMPNLESLLAEADVVSLHVDGRNGNAGLFGDKQFQWMKPRSLFINASRGMVVDDLALREHILSGHIAGAAIDVFPVEPKAQGDPFESALRGLDNVILTPHVGGSTQEAQDEIGHFVAMKLSTFMLEGSTSLSVNLPEVASPRLEQGYRISLLHHNVPGVMAMTNQVLAEENDNITAQYLATRGDRGYVVIDVAQPLCEASLQTLREAESTVWLRTHQPS